METLKPLIEELVQMVKSGKDVISGNLPEVMKQIIAYDTWLAHLLIKVSVVLFIVSIVVFVADYYDAKEDHYAMHGFAIVASILLCIAIMMALVNYSTLKKIEIAPKVYMLDTLHAYLKHD